MSGMMNETAGELNRVFEGEDSVLQAMEIVATAAEKGANNLATMQSLIDA